MMDPDEAAVGAVTLEEGTGGGGSVRGRSGGSEDCFEGVAAEPAAEEHGDVNVGGAAPMGDGEEAAGCAVAVPVECHDGDYGGEQCVRHKLQGDGTK